MVIAATGHRPDKLGHDYDLTGPLCNAIRKRMQDVIDQYEPDAIISGMALGIDTMWAELALENGIELHAYIPCWNQDKMWPQKSRDRYQKILAHPLCKKFIIHAGEYNNFCMNNRNIAMVDNCRILVAVWDGTKGGTANCVLYALNKKKGQKPKVIEINPEVIRTELKQAVH